MPDSDHAYHRRRAALELDQALSAKSMDSAVAHLELARLHRERRLTASAAGLPGPAGPVVAGTDKEA